MQRCGWFFLLFLFSVQNGLAEKEKDEYDFNWLDPDKNIYVVQNRKYTKAGQMELSVTAGTTLSEPFYTVRYVSPRATYYFNESWGISGLGSFVSNTQNDVYIQIIKDSSVFPNVHSIKSFYGASVMWLPFYAKINVFNKIFYFDWYFELGAAAITSRVDLNASKNGIPNLKEESNTGFFFGSGHKYFISKSFAARIEFLMMRYTPNHYTAGQLGNSQDILFNYF